MQCEGLEYIQYFAVQKYLVTKTSVLPRRGLPFGM